MLQKGFVCCRYVLLLFGKDVRSKQDKGETNSLEPRSRFRLEGLEAQSTQPAA